MLDLNWCKKVPNLDALHNLTGLASLELCGWEQVINLDALRGLSSLRSLDLFGCKHLTRLDALRSLTRLESLSLSGCNQLANLDVLRGLTSLTYLSLQYCDLSIFEPVRVLLPTLKILYLYRSTFTDLPQEVCGQEQRDNVIDKVRAHYADLDRGAHVDTELKVFVLGNGGVGKSHLCNRLQGGKYPADPSSIASTHGIQVAEFPLEIDGSEQPANVNLWDFGGQDIYHGSHALFLQQRAVFLLLWHPDLEQGEFCEGGVTMRHRPLVYWLDYVRHVAGPDAPVLIVQAQCDSRAQRKPLPIPVPDDFAFVRLLQVHARRPAPA